VLQDVVAIAFGYGEHLNRDTGTDNIMDKDRQLVDAMVMLVSDTLSSVPHVQPEYASVNGEILLRFGDEEDIQVNGSDIEIVVDDLPTESSFEERIMLPRGSGRQT